MSEINSHVKELADNEMRQSLAKELRCTGPNSGLEIAIIAEHIRSLVWAPYSKKDGLRRSHVHSGRIFSALERNVQIFDGRDGPLVHNGAKRHETFRFVKDQLEALGDVVGVGSGYWIPGPVRVVDIPESQSALVIGGLPLIELEYTLKAPVFAIGPTRYISAIHNPAGSTSIEQWLGHREPLSSWTEKTLSWVRQCLDPQPMIEDTSLEIYAPDMYRGRKQLGYWMSSKDFSEPTQSLRLCRPKVGGLYANDRPNYVGIFKQHQDGARLAQAARVPADIAFRLRFGFDQKYKTPREIRVEKRDESYVADLKFGLPERENRVLGLSWRDRPGSKRVFHHVGFLLFKHVVTNLGMRLILS